MTILDGEGVRKNPQVVIPDPSIGAIFIHPHGSADAPLEHFSMQRAPNGGWVVARGDCQPFIGAFTSFDEAVAWLKQKVAK